MRGGARRGAGQCGAGAGRRPAAGRALCQQPSRRSGGHGGLCGPAGPGRGQPLVVPVAVRGPGAKAALCGGWTWGLPTSGDHDAEAPLVPVRDRPRGRGPAPRESVPWPGRRLGGPAPEGVWSSTRERVPARSLPTPPGMCARGREGSAVRSPGLCGVGSGGEGWGETSNPPRVNPTSSSGDFSSAAVSRQPFN